jgi:catechol 2,3-dioxygenase-like lactoylglutathione lyase family enzyme
MTRYRHAVRVSLAMLIVAAAPSPVQAEPLACDHVQLAVADPAKAAEWYSKMLGGTRAASRNDVTFGTVRITFSKAAKTVPSANSVIDFIGFSYPDVDAKLAELQAAGTKMLTAVLTGGSGFKIASVEDPWGVKVEIVQDLDLLGFHHVHFRTSDPDALVNWLIETSGGERGKVGGKLDGLAYNHLWLVTQKSNDAPAPSAGSAIDHIAWRVANVDETTAALKAKGIKVTAEPRMIGAARVAFIEGPHGLRVELEQR